MRQILSDARRLRAHQAPLCGTLLVDSMRGSSAQSTELDTPLADKAARPNLPASIGVVVFFRLLKSLQQRRNTAGILKLIRQIPSMINNTPALSLSPHLPAEELQVATPTAFAGLATGACPGRVVDAIVSAAEELLCGEDDLSSQQQGYILEAMVGLAVKRGSLTHCLRVVKLLFCSPAAEKGSLIPGVGIHLKVYIGIGGHERSQPSHKHPSISSFTCLLLRLHQSLATLACKEQKTAVYMRQAHLTYIVLLYTALRSSRGRNLPS